jgi:uncharacterized protein YndB with AHSA1/START domain
MKRVGKWLLYAVGGLIGLALLGGLAGLFLPAAVSASASVEIARPPEVVWALLSDPMKTSEWAGDEIVKVELLRPAEPRRYRYTGSMGSAIYEEVISDAPRRLKTRVIESDMGMGGQWDIRIEPAAGGSRVRVEMSMELSNPWFRLLASIMDASRQEEKTLLKLKRHLESRG